LPAVSAPLDLIFLDFAFGRCVDSEHHAHLARFEILLTMRKDREVVVNDDAGVQSAFADLDLPHRLAGLCFDRVNKPVAAALDQQSCAVDVDDDRRRIRCVVRTAAGSAYPHRLPRLFVEGHEAMRTATMLAPLKRHTTDDY